MKKLVVAALFVLCFAAVSEAQVSMSSGAKTSDTQIYTGSAVITGIRARTNGTVDTECKLCDGTGCTGTTVLADWTTLGTAVSNGENLPEGGVRANVGIYLDITTTGGSCIVYYRPGN